MKKLSLMIALSLGTLAANAQMYSVHGHVQDANNNPVAGQVVWVNADTFNNTTFYFQLTDTTDANGDYSVSIPNTTPVGTYLDIRTYATSCTTWYTDSTIYNNQQNYQADFTICANTTTSWVVSGQITTGNQGAEAAIVYLIEQVYDSNAQTTVLTAIDSVYADTMSGYYQMTIGNNYSGVLKLKAALIPGTADYASYLPTYYTSSLNWNGTGVTLINGGMNTTANIALIAGNNPGGPAFIGGDVLQGANKSTAVGDPLSKRILILTDASNNPVAYTYSDNNGEFSITNLAYGTYRMFGDAPGKDNPYIEFTLSATNPSLTDITFQENDSEFWGSMWALSVATTPEMNEVSVYPNPATDVLNVGGLDAIEGTKAISLSSINGAVVFSHTYPANEKVAIPVSGLTSGIYMLQVSTVKGSSIYKIVK